MIPAAAAPAEAAGSTFWVDAATGNDANPGTQAAPFRSIQEAVYRTGPADTIMVLPGTYDASGGINVLGQTLISTGGASVTILQGDGTWPIMHWTSLVTGGDRLQGFTFTNGGTAFSPALQAAAPIEASASNPLVITGNVFSGNHGGDQGGALLVGGPGAVRVEGNTFVGNTATYGAAIKAYQYMTLDVVNNTFQGNSAQQGGALWLMQGPFTIRGNTFSANAATGATAAGGAIWWDGISPSSGPTIEDNLFDSCTAGASGGAVYLKNITLAFRRNRVYGCEAASGGAAYLSGVNLTSEFNHLKGNYASSHGAAWYLDATANVAERNDTLSDHAACADVAYCLPGSWLVVSNSIYWNPAAAAELVKAMGVAYSCTSDHATQLTGNGCNLGPGMIYADPLFDGAGAPKIQLISPCIDVGSDRFVWYPAFDLFWTPLPQDGNADGIAAPDVGCYEKPGLAPVYRFYNFTNNTHFFTPSAEEADSVIANYPKVFRYEGIAYYTNPANNTTPLYRFFNRNSGSHFYTASAEEAAHIIATWPTIFQLDGQTYAVNPGPVPNSTPVYRFFNKTNGSHFYTASAEEADMVIATWPHIYTFEGPAFWLGQ